MNTTFQSLKNKPVLGLMFVGALATCALIYGCSCSIEDEAHAKGKSTSLPDRGWGSGTKKEVTTSPIGGVIPMVRVDGQRGYHVGSAQHPPEDKVDVARFWMATTETTQAQWDEIMGFKTSLNRGGMFPVDSVSWEEAVDFCNKLSEREGLRPCYGRNYRCDMSKNGYRLPTRAEWFLAAIGSSHTVYPWGDDWSRRYCAQPLTRERFKQVNVAAESFTSEVKTKTSNPNGLYDMSGNVAEWCNDTFVEDSCRVFLGGDWTDFTKESFQSRFMAGMPQSERLTSVGFRVVRKG